jgi:excisionase family DNA binding protein
MAENYIDTYQAAEELGMSRATLWRLLREREIERFRIPGDRRSLIRREDFESLRQPVPIPRRATGAKKVAA